MKIVMKTSMAGGHTLIPGQIVEMPEAIALAWIAADIAAPAPVEPAEPAPIEEAIAPPAPERATTRRRKAAK